MLFPSTPGSPGPGVAPVPRTRDTSSRPNRLNPKQRCRLMGEKNTCSCKPRRSGRGWFVSQPYHRSCRLMHTLSEQSHTQRPRCDVQRCKEPQEAVGRQKALVPALRGSRGRGSPEKSPEHMFPSLPPLLDEHFLNAYCGPRLGCVLGTDPPGNKTGSAFREFKFRSLVWDKDNTREWVIPAGNPFLRLSPLTMGRALSLRCFSWIARLNPPCTKGDKGRMIEKWWT